MRDGRQVQEETAVHRRRCQVRPIRLWRMCPNSHIGGLSVLRRIQAGD